MFSIGVVYPHIKRAGIIKVKTHRSACCWVATMDEIAKPMPTIEATNTIKLAYRRGSEPRKGILKIKTATRTKMVASAFV